MGKENLVKLLQLQFSHERKLREFAGKIDLSYFEIDLLSLVLDAIGVPADNTLAQIGKYGYGAWIEQPDTFSRGWFYDEFQRQVIHGTAEECQAYLENMSATNTFQQMLKGHKTKSVAVSA